MISKRVGRHCAVIPSSPQSKFLRRVAGLINRERPPEVPTEVPIDAYWDAYRDDYRDAYNDATEATTEVLTDDRSNALW